MTKFSVGDIVKFKKPIKDNILKTKYIPDFKEPEAVGFNISPEHGSMILGKTYLKNFAKVVGSNDTYSVLEWTSEEEKLMRLAFKNEYLELPKFPKNIRWRDILKR